MCGTAEALCGKIVKGNMLEQHEKECNECLLGKQMETMGNDERSKLAKKLFS